MTFFLPKNGGIKKKHYICSVNISLFEPVAEYFSCIQTLWFLLRIDT